MQQFELFIAVGVIVLVYWVVRRVLEKPRSTALENAAKRMGLSFSAKGPSSIIPACENLPLFAKGHSQAVINLMRNSGSQRDPMVFGYRYTTGSGKHSKTYTQTVALMTNSKTLPVFALRPEKLQHKIGSVFGRDDIDFPDRLEFSKKYWLTGVNKAHSISMLFSPIVTGWFESNEGLCVESDGQHLIVYYNDQRLSPEQIPVFFRQAKGVHDLLDKGRVPASTRVGMGTEPVIKAHRINRRTVAFMLVATISFAGGLQISSV